MSDFDFGLVLGWLAGVITVFAGVFLGKALVRVVNR